MSSNLLKLIKIGNYNEAINSIKNLESSDFSSIDEEGNNVLSVAIIKQKYNLAKEIITRYDELELKIINVNKDGNNELMLLARNFKHYTDLEDESDEKIIIFKKLMINYSNFNQINKDGHCLFFLLIKKMNCCDTSVINGCNLQEIYQNTDKKIIFKTVDKDGISLLGYFDKFQKSSLMKDIKEDIKKFDLKFNVATLNAVLSCRNMTKTFICSDIFLEYFKKSDIDSLFEHKNYGYNGSTLLIHAINNCSTIDFIKELLKYPDKCDLGHKNTDGNTAILTALSRSNVDTINELLKYKDQLNMNSQNNHGFYPLFLLMANSWLSVKETNDLFDKIFEITDKNLLKKSSWDGETILDRSITYDSNEILSKLSKYMYYLNYNNCDALSGNSVIVNAIENNVDSFVIKLLNRKDLNINLIDDQGRNLLILACQKEKEDIAIKLIDMMKPHQLSYTDNFGNTAFLTCCLLGLTTVMKKLLKYQEYINVSQRNKMGISAIDALTNDIPKKPKLKSIASQVQFILNKDLKYKKKKQKLKIIKKHLKNRDKDNICFFCGKNWSKRVIYSECNHTISCCKSCQSDLEKSDEENFNDPDRAVYTCLFCRVKSPSIRTIIQI